jgi:hypothetical protein
MDCTGECFGTASVDNCGTCDADPENDCAADGNGMFGGTSVLDDCGICDGGNVDMDCAGVCYGDSVSDSFGGCCSENLIDGCNQCNGNGWSMCDADEDGISNEEQWGLGAYNLTVVDVPEYLYHKRTC